MGADGDRGVNHTTSTHPPDEMDDLCECSCVWAPPRRGVCVVRPVGAPHTHPSGGTHTV